MVLTTSTKPKFTRTSYATYACLTDRTQYAWQYKWMELGCFFLLDVLVHASWSADEGAVANEAKGHASRWGPLKSCQRACLLHRHASKRFMK